MKGTSSNILLGFGMPAVFFRPCRLQREEKFRYVFVCLCICIFCICGITVLKGKRDRYTAASSQQLRIKVFFYSLICIIIEWTLCFTPFIEGVWTLKIELHCTLNPSISLDSLCATLCPTVPTCEIFNPRKKPPHEYPPQKLPKEWLKNMALS